MKRKAAGKKPRSAKKKLAKGWPKHIFKPAALKSLRIGLRGVARKRKLSPVEGDRLLWRVSGPLKALEGLYQLAKAMFAGKPKVEVAFRKRLLGLMDHSPKGGVALLRQRAGLPKIGRGGRGRKSGSKAMAQPALGFGGQIELDCSVIRPEAMATVYLGTVQAGLGELTQRALDVMATLTIEQGRMEGLNGVLVHDGPAGLEGYLQDSREVGIPEFGQPGDDPGWEGVGYQPDPGDPCPGPDDPWGGKTGSWVPPPPERDSCQGLREGCEAIFIDHVNGEFLPSVVFPRGGSNDVNIESVEMLGHCAGDTIIIHGHDFGDTQPLDLQVVMNVNGSCVIVPVESWTDTQITVILPEGVRSGAIGLYSEARQRAEVDRYNNEVEQYNSAAHEIMMATKCMGEPMLIDLFQKRNPGRDVSCAPIGEHNVIVAGLPVINYFYASTDTGYGVTIVVEPGEDLVLSWEVENANEISLVRSRGTATPVNVGIDLNDTSFDVPPPNHAQFEITTYELTATNDCRGDTKAQVTIIGSKHPGLAIDRIEVTQGIQTLDAGVKLVEGKPTVVRTYITHALNGFGANEVPLVKGILDVSLPNGTYLGSFYPVNVESDPPPPPTPNIDASITVRDLGDPPPPGLNPNDTLNFVIPASLCTGTLDLKVTVRVDSFGPPGQPGFSDLVTSTFKDFTFRPRKHVKLRFIPAFIAQDLIDTGLTLIPGVSNPPTNQQCSAFLEEMLKLLPVTASSIERLDGWSIMIGATSLAITPPFGEPILIPGVNSESLVYDIEANVFTYLLGALRLCELSDLCAEDSDAIWAVLVPVNVWGRANGPPGREFIAQLVDVKCAHELAHCLSQQHLRNTGCASPFGDPWSLPDEITDAANWGHFDGGRILETKAVPFDVVRNTTIASTGGVWDLMSYCVTTWTTPRRWQLIFESVGSA